MQFTNFNNIEQVLGLRVEIVKYFTAKTSPKIFFPSAQCLLCSNETRYQNQCVQMIYSIKINVVDGNKNILCLFVLEENSSSSSRIINFASSWISFVQPFTSGSSHKRWQAFIFISLTGNLKLLPPDCSGIKYKILGRPGGIPNSLLLSYNGYSTLISSRLTLAVW